MLATALERNKLLATLSGADLRAIASIGSVIKRSRHAILCEAGGDLKEAIFPLVGVISLQYPNDSGRTVETGAVDRGGVFGAMGAFGIRTTLVRAVVQFPLTAFAIPAETLGEFAESKRSIFDLCLNYNEALLHQARITAACNVVHPLNARFCRWLLQSSDRVDTDVFDMTQEAISKILGVRRTSITQAAVLLQKDGIIKYSRGKLSILDRPRLLAMACTCPRSPIHLLSR